MSDRPIDRAREAVSVEDLASSVVKLVKAGRERRGPCPLCGAGSSSASGPFAVSPEKGSWKTYCCERRGDVVDLERELRGGTMVEAALRLVGGGYTAPANKPAPRAKKPEGPSASDRVAAELLAGMRPLKGSLAARYLRLRRISDEVIAAVVETGSLGFHPNAKWGWDEERRCWITAPAMIAPVVTALGPTGGVHATYLARDGRKADLQPAKRMWGPQHDKDGRPGGAWLIGPYGEGDLAVGEGIESTLSYVQLHGLPMRAAAALSLNRLQGRWLVDEDGCADVFNPRPDPEGPAFVWPAPGVSTWPQVHVAVDRDMSPVKKLGRTGRGKPMWFELNGETRARLCAALAMSWWLTVANRVRSVAPPPGMDFNTQLQRKLAEGA